MNRTERLYRIDALLREMDTVSLEVFLERLEVSRATLMRDLAYLRDRLNAPIRWDAENRGYRIDTSPEASGRYELPGLWFDAKEIQTLLTMQQLLQDIEPELLAPHIKPLTLRLHAMLDGNGNGTALNEIARRVRLMPMGRRRATSAHFKTLAQAVMARQQLDITHHNRHTNEISERRISPQRLVYYRDNWYVDAWCHARDDLRSFSTDAITRAHVVDIPAHNVSPQSLKARFDAGYGIFSANAAMQWATLRFNPYKTRWVMNEQWHPQQKATPLADGGLQLELPYHDPRELAMDVLRHGGDCQVLEPPELRKLVREQAHALVAAHPD